MVDNIDSMKQISEINSPTNPITRPNLALRRWAGSIMSRLVLRCFFTLRPNMMAIIESSMVSRVMIIP